MNNIIKRAWNQNRMTSIEDLQGMAFQAESGGHTFEISGIDDAGEAVELSGTVSGVFIRPDQTDVALTGTVSDGIVSVTLTSACYAVAGRFGLTIFVTINSQKTAIYAAVGSVARTSTGTVAGSTPQDVVDLINAIEAAVATIPADYTDLMAAIAPTYSNTALYAVGSYVWYDGELYKCTTAITEAESWTAAHWELFSLAQSVAGLNSIDQHMTNYIVPSSSEYIAATLADFDPDFKTYAGVQVTSAGTVSSSSAYASYAFVCPHDGFTFKTNMYRIFVATAYPQVGVTLPIKTVISNNSGDITAVRTVTNKGDIVVLSNAASSGLYLLSQYKNVATINNLALAAPLDAFKQNAIIDSGVSEIGNDKLNIQKADGYLIVTTTGGVSANSTYDTYYFRVPVSELTVKCTNGFRACLSLTDPTLPSRHVSNLKELLYSNDTGRIETFTAHLNDWVVISIGKTSGAIDLKTSYSPRFTMKGLRLDWRQQDSFYRYVENTTLRRLYVYYKSGDKYVRWELHNVPSASNNSDTWQIGAVYGYDEALATGVELVGAGEFELAFKEYGAADYCGGNNHGDENTDDFTLMIDGKAVTLANLDGDYHAFNRIDAIEHATINRCDTPSQDILKHQKVWTFEKGTVKVRQTLEFLEALLCDFLCCMLPANRSAFQYGVRQGRVGTETMTSTEFDRVTTYGNEMMYLMYGANANAKVTARCEDHTPDAALWINNASALNKLYYNFYHGIPNTSVASGTVLHWESEYDIAYN